jgi:hypothetical protein
MKLHGCGRAVSLAQALSILKTGGRPVFTTLERRLYGRCLSRRATPDAFRTSG